MQDLLAPKLLKLAFDPQGLVNPVLHELVDLVQLRVWVVSSTFVWTFF